jgi:hypothetical protein
VAFAVANQFDTASPEILAAVQAGASIEESARMRDVPAATVRRWLREGRKGKRPYVSWSAAVDEARGERKQAERALEGPLSPEEAELLLAKAARKGSVPALRLWFEMRSRDDAGKRGDDARRLLESVFGEGK